MNFNTAQLPRRAAGSPQGSRPAQTQNHPREYVDETPRRPRRTDLERQAEDELGHVFVTLLSVERPAPRYFGDNRGMLPVWVEVNADWRQSGAVFDRNQPALRAVRLAVHGVPSDEHGRRLKRHLDEALHGQQEAAENDALRHGQRFSNGVDWASADDLDTWWTPLLADAVMQCELAAREFEVFGRAEHEARVAARAKLILERQVSGRGR